MSFLHPEDKHPVPKVLRGWVLPVLLLALWWLAARFHWTNSPLLVPVDKVWDTAVEQVRSGELWIALEASLRRDLIGFAIGVSGGLAFGIAFGLSRLFERMIGPTFHTLKLILPAASPSILAGIHLALIYAWLATLGAEYLLVSGKGIGNTMIDGRELFLMDLVIFGVIVVGFVGFALNWLAARLERRLLAWRGRSVAQF